MKNLAILIAFFLSTVAFAQTNPIGIFDAGIDIGKPKMAGSSQYDAQSQTYTIKGGGYNIWFQRDEFHFLHKKLKGDFILTANFEFVGAGKEAHRKIGWMVRESVNDDASHISAVVHGDGLNVLQWRVLRGAYMRDPEDEIFAPKKGPTIIQLERSGNTVTMRQANWGEPLQNVGSHDMNNLKEEVLAGLFISSHNADVLEEARVWNVRIDQPVADNYNPGKDGYLGCRLEIINPFDGKRKVIFEKDGRFEAPNWMPDGKKLLFNMDGLIYKIPVEGGELEKLNTDFATRNNNDHGISFDGKMLAISSHVDGKPGGGSTVYVLPLAGGTPKQVSPGTPSYWHGWNPNNKEVVYVAQRDGVPMYHIYRADINTGKETKLTSHTKGHVDGCEYSPDGKYIYYNGSQSGTMQIWRMKPDGTGNEQITFDQYNNWFPHISPDGKWIAFISFPYTIDAGAHPSYKRVTLKIMPASGGAPKTIAYMYGGQGTINVPSWSPDSKYFAFVSNSGRK
jgi:TolB protein